MSTTSQGPTSEGQSLAISPKSHTISQPTLSGSDRFLEIGGKIVEKVVELRVPILTGVVGIFAVAFSYTGYQSYQSGRNEDGFGEIHTAMAKIPAQQDELARMGINLSDVPRPPEEEAERKSKSEEAAKALQQVGSDYSGLSAGQLALIERARLLEIAGKPEEALQAWQEAVNSSREPIFLFKALSGLGNAYRTEKKYTEAAQQFDRARTSLDGLWKELATLELARTYELSEDQPKAIGLYQELAKQTPPSRFAEEATSRIAALKSPAAPGQVESTAPAPAAASGETP